MKSNDPFDALAIAQLIIARSLLGPNYEPSKGMPTEGVVLVSNDTGLFDLEGFDTLDGLLGELKNYIAKARRIAEKEFELSSYANSHAIAGFQYAVTADVDLASNTLLNWLRIATRLILKPLAKPAASA